MSASSTTTPAASTSQQQQVQINPRGIPHAPFITNVQEHLGGPDEDVEPTLRKFQETMSKYKFMEMNTAQRRGGLEDKIPDIRKTLQMVEFLKQSRDNPDPIKTTFELNETLYAKAELEQTDKVHLWLGANVMLSYPLDEAIELLTTKLKSAETSLVAAKEDLDFLREQITIMEVNTARVHNWDVKRRRERREQLEQQGISGSGAAAKASTWLRDDKGREDGVPPARPPAEATTTTTTTTSDVVGRSEEAGAETEDTTATTTAADSTLASTAAMTAPLFGPSGGGGSGGGVGASLPDAPPQAAAPTTAAAGAPVAPPGAMGTTLASTTATGTAPKVGEQTTTQPPTTPTAARPNISTATTTATTTTTARAATQAATPPLHNHFQSNLTVVPPLNFDMISPGVYRSGHPNERNFGFLKRLNLKSVMYLANEEYRTNMTTWAQSQGIRIFHFRLDLNKEPLAEMDSTMVTSALLTILDPRNLPMLIHCNKGKYRVGCMAGLLRRLQGWSHTSIFEEYARFAGSRIADTEFIEVFDLSPVYAARINAKRSSSAAAAASSS